VKCTILIKRYLHLLVRQVAVLRCFGQIPFRCEQHFHRLSGFWSHTRSSLKFLCKDNRNRASVRKNNLSAQFHKFDFSESSNAFPVGLPTDLCVITEMSCDVLVEVLQFNQFRTIDLHWSRLITWIL